MVCNVDGWLVVRCSSRFPRHIGSSLETLIPDTTERAMSPETLELELERLHPMALGWAIACCAGDRHAAEDAIQASYLKILDGRARFEGRSTFRTWLFAVVRRTAAEQRRRAALRRLLPLAVLWATPDGRPDPATALARSEATSRLVAALSGLSPRQREVLHLVFYQDLTIDGAADVMGVSLGTARTHYERGKAALRKLLEEDRE
jgi:RNA polymerase sigma factor (sigma-70 family)